ncbi:hypothetical protein DL96DRAFT_1631631 [Flagelloscypha sp. PMI_526]|nr:hypothetical protein DL96DRAFT_1631631 [Flagelloscypha sp. PMI_526]
MRYPALQTWLYRLPEPPIRRRTKPMKLICVGPSRSGTESLADALGKLGYTTYHGWNLFLEDAGYVQKWHELAASSGGDPDVKITREEFDELLGHADVVLDLVAVYFTRELIEAYPEAQVILNQRESYQAWHSSISKIFSLPWFTLYFCMFVGLFEKETFWINQFFQWPYARVFRSSDSWWAAPGLKSCGIWVLKEHMAMVRGLVPPERRLEWGPEKGWEPLCKFLGTDVPKEVPFPYLNHGEAFAKRVEERFKGRLVEALFNLIFVLAGVLLTSVFVWKLPRFL